MITQVTCVRCAHVWWPRSPERPLRCAGCKALRWDTPARVAAPKLPRGPRGAHRKYPIHKLEIGDSILMPFFLMDNGTADMNKNSSMQSAVVSYGKRSGKVFKRENTPAGLRVTRLA